MPTLTYQQMFDKAQRALVRLENAELELDEDGARDAAIDAATTTFHLLEWKEKTVNPNSTAGGHGLAKGKPDFELLHDIVTHIKHVNVSRGFMQTIPDVRSSAGTMDFNILCEDGSKILLEDGGHLMGSQKRLYVKFDAEPAVDLIMRALKSL